MVENKRGVYSNFNTKKSIPMLKHRMAYWNQNTKIDETNTYSYCNGNGNVENG